MSVRTVFANERVEWEHVTEMEWAILVQVDDLVVLNFNVWKATARRWHIPPVQHGRPQEVSLHITVVPV